MKILYIGTVSENSEYERIVKKSRVKPSVAPQAFETAFVKGCFDAGVSSECIDFLSFPMIASFPGSGIIGWGARKQKLFDTYDLTWIPTINLQGIKLLSQSVSSKLNIEKWLRSNIEEKDKCVLMYSLYQPIAKNVVNLCKKYNCKCFAFVPDLPKHMYYAQKGFKAHFAESYVKKALEIQGCFDGYIYLTDAMKYEIAPSKPYIIVEGIADTAGCKEMRHTRKDNVIMYAGAISERYGLNNLLQAFSAIEGDYELHIYGYGDFVESLNKFVEKDKRIKYFGRQPRDKIINKEKEAALLVNVRDPKDDFTRYSFPSKTIEYMISGTPLLTTRLEGIPEEYFGYCLSISDNDVVSIKTAVENFFKMPNSNRIEIGTNANDFITSQKNHTIQAKKILSFINECIHDNKEV